MRTAKSLPTILQECYQKGYQSAITAQRKRGYAPEPPSEIGEKLFEVLSQLVEDNRATEAQVKNLARRLGKLEYGEWGLTQPRAEPEIRKVFAGLEIHSLHQLFREIGTTLPHR